MSNASPRGRTQRDAGSRRPWPTPKSAPTTTLRRRFERFRSNILRRTRAYHSEPTHFHYPGLAEREFHPAPAFPWLERARSGDRGHRRGIRRRSWRPSAPSWCPTSNMPSTSRSISGARSTRAATGPRSTCCRTASGSTPTLAIAREPWRCSRPATSRRSRGASPNAMFSLLAPNTAIPPHVGVNNARLVCHLPLIVPDGCWFRVGGETRYWRTGEAFVFDDTIEHEALNPSDELRVVLIFDVWRPELRAGRAPGDRRCDRGRNARCRGRTSRRRCRSTLTSSRISPGKR